MTTRFPKHKAELIRLGTEDQQEIRSHYQKRDALDSDAAKRALDAQLAAHCHARAARMMEILEVIGEPRISYVGIEGSEMISLLALHSYIDEMKAVLARYERVYEHDPSDIYKESIPSLTDRILIYEHRMQRYGNNWFVDKNGRYFLAPVEDFAHMNERRAQFGLGPRMKPTVYALGEEKYPLGQGEATESDQKPLTDEEYAAFIKTLVRPDRS